MTTVTVEASANSNKSVVSIETVKKAILDYVKVHQGVNTSDLLFELDFDPELVIDTLDVLEEEGLLEGKPVTK
jgi:Mn-dependent DtxR family transcriptional regulator